MSAITSLCSQIIKDKLIGFSAMEMLTVERSLLLAALVVITASIVLFASIRHWGPGRARRVVRCPDKHVQAWLTATYIEQGFGSIQASEVTHCSLFPSVPAACRKQCLFQV
jgi:hypothetical protein